MRKRYEEGGEIDAMEAANKSEEAMDIAKSVGAGPKNTDIPKAKPKAKPKAAVRDTGSDVERMAKRGKSAEMPADVTKMSLAERAKASRESARAGSGTTDRRSVGERLKSAFGMKSGGSVGSASRRADGIATKGKTRGKMC